MKSGINKQEKTRECALSVSISLRYIYMTQEKPKKLWGNLFLNGGIVFAIFSIFS
jgi:hypothetical protein